MAVPSRLVIAEATQYTMVLVSAVDLVFGASRTVNTLNMQILRCRGQTSRLLFLACANSFLQALSQGACYGNSMAACHVANLSMSQQLPHERT